MKYFSIKAVQIAIEVSLIILLILAGLIRRQPARSIWDISEKIYRRVTAKRSPGHIVSCLREDLIIEGATNPSKCSNLEEFI